VDSSLARIVKGEPPSGSSRAGQNYGSNDEWCSGNVEKGGIRYAAAMSSEREIADAAVPPFVQRGPCVLDYEEV